MTQSFQLSRIAPRTLAIAIAACAAILGFTISAHATHAATCTFTGAVSSDFNTNGNWNCGFTPGATSTAIIPTATSTSLSAPATVATLLVNTNATLTTTGFDFTSFGLTSSTGAIVAGGANTFTVGGAFDLRNGGRFTPGNGTFVFATSTAAGFQSVDADTQTTLTFNNLVVSSTPEVVMSNFESDVHVVVNGNLSINAGRMSLDDGSDLVVSGTTHVLAGTILYFGASATFDSTTTNSGLMVTSVLGGTMTFNGDFVNTASGSLDSDGPGTGVAIVFNKAWNNAGVFELAGPGPFDSTVIFSGSASQTIPAGVTFANLVVDNAAGVTMAGSASTTGTLTVSSTASSLDVGNNTLTATGLITNLGLITEGASGHIIHPAEGVHFTDVNGVTQGSYTSPASVYFQVQDSNRNLSGTTTESFTIPVSITPGADAETLTLTETSSTSGIFRSAAVSLVSSSVASPGNSQFEVVAAGSANGTYTDNQDPSDVVTGTASVTPASSGGGGGGGGGGSSGGGGGGGLGSSGSNALAPLTTQYQSYLANLQSIGVPVHALVKLPDDGNVNTQEDSAVYYIGTDGMRHAFPNSKVYFTWYQDFSGVQLVNSTQLASIPLGKNVTYKPGVKMVKFTTDPKVYAVEKGGNLRWVTTEAVATSLYGTSWNTMIDDISDAFYSNYQFGTSINSTSDYSPSAAQASVQFPSDSLQM